MKFDEVRGVGKSDYKKLSNKENCVKENCVQNRLRHKNIYCVSKDYVKWAKTYLSRSDRRKHKQDLKTRFKKEDYQ